MSEPPREQTDRAREGQGGRRRGECTIGVCDPQRTQGLQAPAPEGEYALVNLDGPGTFVAAAVSKQGGTGDITFVILDIDGRNVVNISYAATKNLGLTQQNPFGLVLLETPGTATVKNLTIGFPTPLRFEESLRLSVLVKESGVLQVLANVIHGS
jgi:hypothetical protein